MHLTIEEVVGDRTISFDIDGNYEEVLALTAELGCCKESVPQSQKIEQVLADALSVGQLLSK